MAGRKSGQPLWTAVDQYMGDLFRPSDEHLDAALNANRKAGLPAIDVSPLQGRFLHVLVQMTRAKRILEIGLLGGYSTIWMAQAQPRGGRIVSLEFNPKHAEIARANLKRAGVLSRVDIRVGPALDSLPVVASERGGKFDLIFIDADKSNNLGYVQAALALSRPGALIVVDNVVRDGAVIARRRDAAADGIRRMTEWLAREPRLTATVLQTVGAKGYDGFLFARVQAGP